MKLLYFENYEVKIHPEALLIKPIRKLYNQDRSQKKEAFMQQMAYIYFMVDPRSTYTYIVNEEEREKAILTEQGMKKFKVTPLLKEAMEVYRKSTVTSSSALLESTRMAVDKIQKFLQNIDLNAVDRNDKPVYQISQVVSAVKQIPQLAKDLIAAEKAVEAEMLEESKARGTQEKTILDDGIQM